MSLKSTVFFVLLLIVSVCAYSSDDSKTYKVCYYRDFVPYVNYDTITHEWNGIILDWWNLWATKAGVSVEFIPMTIDSCIEQTVTGKTDFIAALFYSEERAEKLDFSEPILRMKSVLFLRKGMKPDSIAAITETIGVVDEDVVISFLNGQYPGLNLEVFSSSDSLQKYISNKQIAGFVYDIPDLPGNYKSLDTPDGYRVYETLYSQSLRAAVRSGNKDLLNLLLSGSSKITAEEIFTIAGKWNLYKPKRNIVWILLITGVVLGILLVLVILRINRNRLKMRQIEQMDERAWKSIIDKGENDKTEFKSSMRWDYRQEKSNKMLEKVIAKTISAFLNSQGGRLFIGVDDDGNILGLDKDYGCMSKSNSDGFLLSLTNLVNNYLGKSFHRFLNIMIVLIDGKEVCVIHIEASDKPVFLGKQDNEEFFIRASASSQPLGVRETYNYIKSHWK